MRSTRFTSILYFSIRRAAFIICRISRFNSNPGNQRRDFSDATVPVLARLTKLRCFSRFVFTQTQSLHYPISGIHHS
ncbi:hypothetical protein KCP74_15385 [Salmonella enterica subsp. enterica]|nr:hypothetical protein KCP74_15385 [Salmonella enterica subsp. enterica]